MHYLLDICLCVSYGALWIIFIALWANSAADKLMILVFPEKTGSDISCKLSPAEPLSMKFQNLFCGKSKKIF